MKFYKFSILAAVETCRALQFERCTAGRGVGLRRSLQRYWSQEPLRRSGPHCESTAQPASSLHRQPLARGHSLAGYQNIDWCKKLVQKNKKNEQTGWWVWRVWGPGAPAWPHHPSLPNSTVRNSCCWQHRPLLSFSFFFFFNISTQAHKHQCLV